MFNYARSWFYELRRKLEYKAAWRGGHVVLGDRWYPSSKMCSCCGYRLEVLDLGTRQWSCSGCGQLHDRDINAAINHEEHGGEFHRAGLWRGRRWPCAQAQDETGPAQQESNGELNYG